MIYITQIRLVGGTRHEHIAGVICDAVAKGRYGMIATNLVLGSWPVLCFAFRAANGIGAHEFPVIVLHYVTAIFVLL